MTKFHTSNLIRSQWWSFKGQMPRNLKQKGKPPGPDYEELWWERKIAKFTSTKSYAATAGSM